MGQLQEEKTQVVIKAAGENTSMRQIRLRFGRQGEVGPCRSRPEHSGRGKTQKRKRQMAMAVGEGKRPEKEGR